MSDLYRIDPDITRGFGHGDVDDLVAKKVLVPASVDDLKAALADEWWVERERGQRIAGPFRFEDDAFKARVHIEAVMKPETFWIRRAALGGTDDS